MDLIAAMAAFGSTMRKTRNMKKKGPQSFINDFQFGFVKAI
jgi:hypothetical protein